MFWFALTQIITLVFELLHLHRQPTHEKDLEILLLRRQLAILQRHNNQVVRPSRSDKFILTVLTLQLKKIAKSTTTQLRDVLSIVQPETVLRWHRELVRRKWTLKRHSSGGRPSTDSTLEALVVQLARENDWGYGKIMGELRKLGYSISEQTIANILKRHGLAPLPERTPSSSWQHLMTHYKEQLLACDFFTVETLFLQTIYVLFFIEIGSRRVHFAGCTAQPNQVWVTQQARQLIWKLDDNDISIGFLIHDRDTKFSSAFDTIFQSEKIDIIQTPFQAPNANAFAECWIRSAREECLDKLIVINQAHLRQVMIEYINYYNTARPHHGIQQTIPVARPRPLSSGQVRCRDVLSGIIHDYYRETA